MSEAVGLQTPNPEVPSGELAYPFEYFEAQVSFAQKWAEVSGLPLADALKSKTALYRRITNKKSNPNDPDSRWVNLITRILTNEPLDDISHQVFDTFKNQSHARYVPPSYPQNDGKHFGFFSFDYYQNNSANEGRNSIKVHFLNPIRGGIGSLHPSLMSARRDSLQRMFAHIQIEYPDATHVMGGSWLYHIPQYTGTFPEAFTRNMRTLVPAGFEPDFPSSIGNMSFNGDSLWGQFVNRFGGPRTRALVPFIESVAKASDPLGLIRAFPNLPLQPMCEIGEFYQDLNI